jgi:hypothetical protein
VITKSRTKEETRGRSVLFEKQEIRSEVDCETNSVERIESYEWRVNEVYSKKKVYFDE